MFSASDWTTMPCTIKVLVISSGGSLIKIDVNNVYEDFGPRCCGSCHCPGRRQCETSFESEELSHSVRKSMYAGAKTRV